MYHPGIPWIPQVFPRCSLLCTNTFIPGRTRGVVLKSNGPSIVVYKNIVGVFRQVLNIFKLIVSFGMRQHQRCIGNLVSVISITAIKRYFNVRMSRSSALTQCMCGGNKWYPMSSCQLYFLMLDEA